MWYGKNDDRQDETCVCRIDPAVQKALIDRALTTAKRLATQQRLEAIFDSMIEQDSLSETKKNISEAIQKLLGTK